MKMDEFAKKPIRTLGEVILLLEGQPERNTVKLDFTNEIPTSLHSYRGYYEDLSLGCSPNARPMTVERLLKRFKDAKGQTFEGYKGGDFTMGEYTEVWLSEYGTCGEGLGPILLSYM
ncbi:hypothetical protein LCGC14_1709530, partial [marine sediment metagenome]